MTDFYLSAPTQAAMETGLTAVGMYGASDFVFNGPVRVNEWWTLRVLGLLSEFTPGSEHQNTEPNIQVASNGPPLFWVRVGWNSIEPPPAWAANGLTVYNADGSAVTPPFDPTPNP